MHKEIYRLLRFTWCRPRYRKCYGCAENLVEWVENGSKVA